MYDSLNNYYIFLEILQFKSESVVSNKKAKDNLKKISKPKQIVVQRNQYKFDAEVTRENDKVSEVKDFGVVFR